MLTLACDAQTNSQIASPQFKIVLVTNRIEAAPTFREVGGQLYNIKRSVLWTNFQGECLEIETNAIVISTFTMEPIYQAATTTEYVPTGEFSPDKPVLVATKIKVGENKVLGRKIILQNYPANLYAAIGEPISFRAIKIGTSNYKGEILELWDYGTPHIVTMIKTNLVSATSK